MMVYVNHGGDGHDEGRVAGRLRFRSPTTPIDWLVIALDVVAVFAGSIALFGSSHISDRSTVVPGDHAHELTSWRMAALPVAFSGLVALSLVEARWVRQVSSVLAVGIALTGLVGWWWTEIDDLLGQTFLDTGHVTIGGDIVIGGIAVGLQIFAGLLMFMAAFPLSDEAFADA